MPVLKTNIRTLNAYVESLKLHNCCFVVYMCTCILYLPEQWKWCTKLPQMTAFSLCNTITFFQYFTFGFPMNKEGLKGKGTIGYLSFSCYAIIFRLTGWLIQGSNTSKKRYDKLPRLFMFLRMELPSSAFEANSDSNRKCSLSGLSAYSVEDITCLAWTCFEVHQTTHCESRRILCPWSVTNTLCEWGSKRWQNIYWTFLLCSRVCSIVLWDFTFQIQVQRQNY